MSSFLKANQVCKVVNSGCLKCVYPKWYAALHTCVLPVLHKLHSALCSDHTPSSYVIHVAMHHEAGVAATFEYVRLKVRIYSTAQ